MLGKFKIKDTLTISISKAHLGSTGCYNSNAMTIHQTTTEIVGLPLSNAKFCWSHFLWGGE